MRLLLKILPCLIGVLILSGCASNTSQTPFGEAKTNFDQKNYQNAFAKIQGPASAGNAEAQYALGYMYYYGKGTPVNQALGKQWILKAAQTGNKNAQQAYQMILAQEQQITPPAEATNMALPVAIHNKNKRQDAPTAHPATIKTAIASPVVKTASPITKSVTTLPIKAASKPTKTVTAIVPPVPKTNQKHAQVKSQPLAVNKQQHYTIQLVAASKESNAKAYINQHQLGSMAKASPRKVKDKVFYVVNYGDYPTREAALVAIKTLPAEVQATKPWVRRVTNG